jgi:hypothetical protein
MPVPMTVELLLEAFKDATNQKIIDFFGLEEQVIIFGEGPEARAVCSIDGKIAIRPIRRCAAYTHAEAKNLPPALLAKVKDRARRPSDTEPPETEKAGQ